MIKNCTRRGELPEAKNQGASSEQYRLTTRLPCTKSVLHLSKKKKNNMNFEEKKQLYENKISK
jgi:hypothetical protein